MVLLKFMLFEVLAVEPEVVGYFFATFALFLLAFGAMEPILRVVLSHRGCDGVSCLDEFIPSAVFLGASEDFPF